MHMKARIGPRPIIQARARTHYPRREARARVLASGPGSLFGIRIPPPAGVSLAVGEGNARLVCGAGTLRSWQPRGIPIKRKGAAAAGPRMRGARTPAKAPRTAHRGLRM